MFTPLIDNPTDWQNGVWHGVRQRAHGGDGAARGPPWHRPGQVEEGGQEVQLLQHIMTWGPASRRPQVQSPWSSSRGVCDIEVWAPVTALTLMFTIYCLGVYGLTYPLCSRVHHNLKTKDFVCSKICCQTPDKMFMFRHLKSMLIYIMRRRFAEGSLNMPSKFFVWVHGNLSKRHWPIKFKYFTWKVR